MVKKNKPCVLITWQIPDIGLRIIKTHCEVIMNNNDRPLKHGELINMVKNVDAILCFLNDKIDKLVMEAAGPSLKIISTYSTGYEHIDTVEAKNRGIEIGYTGNILTETTADLGFGLLISLGRRIVEADRFVRDRKWKHGWNPSLMIGTDIHDKTIGIVGMGKIGQAISKRALGFGMKILYTKRNLRQDEFKEQLSKGIEYCNLQRLIAESDYVIICCSLNKDSYHLIDYEKIKIMKKTAYLINISRGKIIKEQDLILALQQNEIAGAGLDVFEEEPIAEGNPLLKMNNVILLPHIGSSSLDTRNKMAEIAALNIINVLNHQRQKALLLE